LVRVPKLIITAAARQGFARLAAGLLRTLYAAGGNRCGERGAVEIFGHC
jgi:hypothetical protein